MGETIFSLHESVAAAGGEAVATPSNRREWHLSEPHYVRSFSWGNVRAEMARRRAGEGRVCLPQHITCITMSKEKRTEIQIDDGTSKKVTVPRHSFSFIPAGTPVSAVHDSDYEYLCVFQDADVFDAIAKSMPNETGGQLKYMASVTDPLVTQVMLAISQEARDEGINGKLYVDALSQTLASRILQLQSSSQFDEEAEEGSSSGFDLETVVDYINAYLIEDLSVGELSKLVDMNPYAFSRAFKQATGTSPYQFVLNKRIERAKSLLKDPTVSIADVAYHVGFSSQSHMTTVFSKNIGVTPKVYRESSF